MLFKVKVQLDENGKSKISWMKPDKIYTVLDIYKYKEKADTKAGFKFVTWVFLGDKDTGMLSWVNAQVLNYVEDKSNEG